MSNSNLIAVILLGGKGKRMGNYTLNNHKSLLKVGNFNILSHLYTQLRILGIKEIVMCIGHFSLKIKKYVKNHIMDDSNKILKIIKKKTNNNHVKVLFSYSNANSSTSKRLKKVKKIIKNRNIVLLYGDTLLKISKNNFKSNKKNINLIDIILTVSNPPEKFGVAKFKKEKLISYNEKKINKNKWVNSGWMFLNNSVFKFINKVDLNFEQYILNNTKKFDIRVSKNKYFYLPIDNIYDLNTAKLAWKNSRKTWY